MNTRSIATNLQFFVDSAFGNTHVKLDILEFTETRLDPDLASLYQLPGYNLSNNCRHRYGGGVVMCFR